MIADSTPPLLDAAESPHWPLGRARTERDRLLDQLTIGQDHLPASDARLLGALRWDWSPSNEAFWRRLCFTRNTRTLHYLRRYSLFCRYVQALESRSAPPPNFC